MAAKYTIAEDVLARSVGSDIVLLHPESERLLMLSGTGPRVWELLSAGGDLEEIVSRLVQEYDGAREVIRDEVEAFLADLEREQIVSAI